jgi:hypothetical protein
MKKSKTVKAVVSIAAGVTMAVMVGQIMPINMHSGSSDFSMFQVNADCCGPHPISGCGDLVGPVEPK